MTKPLQTIAPLHSRGQFFVDGTMPIDNFAFIETNEDAANRIKGTPNIVRIDATADVIYVEWKHPRSHKMEMFSNYSRALRRMADILDGTCSWDVFGQPKTIKPEMCAAIRMTTGGEKKYPIVIDGGMVKEWIGFGWISLDTAEPEQYNQYPRIDRS